MSSFDRPTQPAPEPNVPEGGDSAPDRDAPRDAPRGDSGGDTAAESTPLTPMEKWEAAEDRILTENIAGIRTEADILRQQGNPGAAAELEKRIPYLESLIGPDAGGPDAGGPDAGGRDAGGPDAGGRDAGGPEPGGPEAVRDAGGPDAGGPEPGGPEAVPDAGGPDAGELSESSHWLMQLHVEGPRGPVDDRAGYIDPDGIRTDRYWMPVDDLVTNDQRVANGNWGEFCDRLDIPPGDQLRDLYEPDQMVKEWDLVAAQHGLPPEWGARTEVTFARADDVSPTTVAPALYAPWSAGGDVKSFPEPLPAGPDTDEQRGGDSGAAFSYRGIPMPMGNEVHFAGHPDTPENDGTPQDSSGGPLLHGPAHEVPELADRVIAAADAAAGGDPLGRSIEIGVTMSDQTFRLDRGQDPPVAARDSAGNLQDGDQRYREEGALPDYGDDGRIMGTGGTPQNEVTGERVAPGGTPDTSDPFRFNDQTGANRAESVPVWESSDAMLAAYERAEAEYERGMDPAERDTFVRSLRDQADRQREQGNDAAADSLQERIRLLSEPQGS